MTNHATGVAIHIDSKEPRTHNTLSYEYRAFTNISAVDVKSYRLPRLRFSIADGIVVDEGQIIIMGSIEHAPEQPDAVQVTLPEMFLFFLAQNPRVNPYYENIRRESEEWLLK